MLDIGWTELLVIGALALIVVGPRDLPQLLRTVGQTVGKIKRMAREFQRSVEDAARETDVANMKEFRDIKKDMGSLDFRQQASKAQSYLNQPVKPDGEAVKTEAGKASAPETKTAAKPAVTESPAAPAGPAATPAPAPVESGARRPAAAPGAAAPGAAAPEPSGEPEPRQAGAKG